MPLQPISIYVHVPFCRSKCAYCDFYSIANHDLMSDYAALVIDEMRQRRGFAPSAQVCTVYVGGGTPSLLPPEQLALVVDAVRAEFTVHPNAELTLEANPDDLHPALLSSYRAMGFNRLSLGVQSMDDGELAALGRRHTAQRAAEAVRMAQRKGFDNISIDLIYGLPDSTTATWRHTLEAALQLGVQHLSCYHLTVEERTRLHQQVRRGQVQPVAEEQSVAQFELLRQLTAQAGFEHYEISNFALPGMESRHNSGYWLNRPYLGLGPAAHSYDGRSRQWNSRSLRLWANGLRCGQPAVEREVLSPTDMYNEMLLTRLRTKWGVSLAEVELRFGKEARQRLQGQATPLLRSGVLVLRNADVLLIPPAGYLTSDALLVELFADNGPLGIS
ncbi:MAG: radical SAM family heme chaperone HemW [Bacteroidales bacterium]|nr:radical SAM family heme chaperone HemW [Bacteroidales bacterium]